MVLVDKSAGLTVTVDPLMETVPAVAWKTCATLPVADEPVHDDVAVQIRMYLPATAVTVSLNSMTTFEEIDTPVALSAGVVGVIVGTTPSTLCED